MYNFSQFSQAICYILTYEHKHMFNIAPERLPINTKVFREKNF